MDETHETGTDVVPDGPLTIQEYADHRGVDERTVRRWRQRGLLSLTENGLIEPGPSDEKVDSSLDLRRSHRKREADLEEEVGDLKEWLTRKERALARMRELEVEVKEGMFVPVEEVEKDADRIADELIAAYDQMKVRMRNRLLPLVDPERADLHALDQLLDEEIVTMRNQVAVGFRGADGP